MSADNRVIIAEGYDGLFHVWEGSCSSNYFEPPPDALCFETQKKALDSAMSTNENFFLEGGIQSLTDEERLDALNDEINRLSRLKRRIIKNITNKHYLLNNKNYNKNNAVH